MIDIKTLSMACTYNLEKCVYIGKCKIALKMNSYCKKAFAAVILISYMQMKYLFWPIYLCLKTLQKANFVERGFKHWTLHSRGLPWQAYQSVFLLSYSSPLYKTTVQWSLVFVYLTLCLPPQYPLLLKNF